MTITTTPKKQKTNKKIWKERVLSGKELAKSRWESKMRHRKKANEQNKIKKKLIIQRNLIKELRKALREETKLRKDLEKQLKKK